MSDNSGEERIKKMFPKYFDRFELPEEAHEESLRVYRACRSGKCDKDSFLPTFEEKGFRIEEGDDPKDPGIYALSTYEKPRDIKRFADMTSDMKVPYTIAVGYTDPAYGQIQRTRERKRKEGNRKYKSSHVDWWLYEGANPHKVFELIPDFQKHLDEYKNEKR